FVRLGAGRPTAYRQPPVTPHTPIRRRSLHPWVVLTLAFVLGVGLPVGTAPSSARAATEPAAAAAAMPFDPSTSRGTAHRPIGDVDPADGAGPPDAPGSPAGSPEDEPLPTIHYEDALAHAGDAPSFEPGDRVHVPFTPRKTDTWEVDGHAPRALPAGHASGKEIRAASPTATWAKGRPADLGGASAETTIEPASYLGTTTSDDVTSAALVGTNGLRREVFGFLPYWEVADPTTTLDWKTLSTVAYF